jgi:hypothetical protein
MILEPPDKLIAGLALPLVTATPFTVTLAVASETVGVSVMFAVLMLTDAE